MKHNQETKIWIASFLYFLNVVHLLLGSLLQQQLVLPHKAFKTLQLTPLSCLDTPALHVFVVCRIKFPDSGFPSTATIPFTVLFGAE